MALHEPAVSQILVPGNSTSPRDHTLSSGQDRSLTPYPKSSQLPEFLNASLVQTLFPAGCSLPVESGRATRRQESESRLQSKSSSSC